MESGKKGGRRGPPKAYPCRLMVYLTENDLAAVRALAEEAGVSVAGVVRGCIRQRAAEVFGDRWRCLPPAPPAGEEQG